MSVPRRGTAVHLEPPGPEPEGLGRFGEFGGRFAPETLVPALVDLEANFRDAWTDDAFRAEYAELLSSYVGRPTPVTECERLSDRLGVRVLLKREDLAHTGSHKINNVLGQCLLTRRMGKQRVIAETGAGQHGVAAATGAAMGPHPFPWMVREFQRVVGDEARAQTQALLDGKDPDFVIACVGGGSNAIGTFTAFIESDARLVGVEAGGLGLETGHHGAAVSR